MKNNNTQTLQMKFAPNTIEHLGVNMYSTLPPVVSELIANSYDADAGLVTISLKDSSDKEIVVSDNGHGMSFDEINDSFLTIGRNRRTKNETDLSPKGRKVIGKKGLGKLSFFGIAHRITITTVKDGKKNSFVMDWETIMSKENDEGGIENYEPEILILDESTQDSNGTIVTLQKIQRVSNFDVNVLADSISKYFILPENFSIKLSHNDGDWIEIDNRRRYSTLSTEVEWKVPAEIKFPSDFEYSEHITGHILATEKPISPSTNMRGITLFSRTKLVNLPEYFSDSTSSHFFNYLTGWLEVDFIDELEEDVIGTNRQTLNWDHPEMRKLKSCLQNMLRWLERDWREKRKEIREKKLNDELKRKTGITISEWQQNVPDKIKIDLTPVLEKIIGDSELSNEEMTGAVKHLKNIAPEYTYYHHRYLHRILSEEVFEYYTNKDYYTAVFEGVKRYVQKVKDKAGSDLTDRGLLENIFAINDPQYSVINKFKRPNGNSFSRDTIRNITSGHQKLVIAMWEAFRSPMAHEPAKDLRDSGLYTKQDCLDALSLLSHLFRRLDNLEKL